MRNKSVAVLDVRSGEICAAIAEKGVNNTFIIKSKYTCPYEGYAEGELLDVAGFISAVKSAFGNINDSVGNAIKEVYIGVPCEFVRCKCVEKVVSFSSSRKITARHVESLIDSAFPEVEEGESVIDYGEMCYTLSDKRKLIDPIGMVSDSLRARLSFFICKNSFMNCVKRAFSKFETVKNFNWIPQNYSQAMYLIDTDKRDSYAILFDFGYISSTFSVACGNGIAYSESFSVGVGHIAVLLMEELEIPYEVAKALVAQVNLNARDRLTSFEEFNYEGKQYSFPSSQLRELIREGLDAVCEMVEACRQSFTEKDLSSIPVNVTGEGISVIKGTIEHLSSRLVTPVEIVTPKVPYYDKNVYSSLFSLLSSALDGNVI